MSQLLPKLTPILSSLPSCASAFSRSTSQFDGILFIFSTIEKTFSSSYVSKFQSIISNYHSIDASINKNVSLVHCTDAPGGRLILSPLNGLTGDTDDVRKFWDAAKKGMTRAIDSGMSKILVVVPEEEQFEKLDGQCGGDYHR